MRLQLQGRFDEGCEEAGDEVPVYMAVECPDAYRFSVSEGFWEAKSDQGLGVLIWVVGYEAEGHVTAPVDFDYVATYGRCGGVDGLSAVDAGVGCGALHYLEIVAVDMDRMAACVEIVDHYFDYVVVM